MTPEDLKVVIHADKTPSGERRRMFNAQVADEVVIIMAGDQCQPSDIILWQRDLQLKGKLMHKWLMMP